MKTIMVDMDDVITDGHFFRYICEFLGKEIDINSVKTYYLQDLVEDRKEEFWQWIKDKNFYADSCLYQDCYEVLKKYNSKFDISIVTTYRWNDIIDISGKVMADKYEFLKDNLPFLGTDKYIFASNKQLMNFDIRIDDRMNNLEGAKIKLLYDQWHNRDIPEETLKEKNIIRVYNWKEIDQILEGIE